MRLRWSDVACAARGMLSASRKTALVVGGSVLLLSGAALQAADGDGSSTPLPIPPLTAHVNDLTNTLDAQQRQTLEGELTALQTSKGSQLGVLIVPTTQPEDIAQYGIRVGDAWKLGRKGTDDGVIVIVAKDDRKVRIEVGRGLEGAIPDAAAARIIREYITPKFRANDYFGGIHDATGVLAGLINGEPLPPPLTPEHNSQAQGDWFNAVIFAFFAILWARAMFGRLPGPPRGGLVGIVGAGAAWLLSGGMIPLAIGLGVVGLVLGLLGGGGGGFANRGGWGGFPGGGFGGGGFGGGGGGGFSGGGGGFGGGGASGSW
jgi:uncharacterized protein